MMITQKQIPFIDNLQSIKMLNEYLLPYGLSTFKIILMLILFVVIYFIRKVLFDLIENYISNIKSLNIYSKNISNSIRKLLEIVFIVINIELSIYIYNDFSSMGTFGIYFNALYAFLITLVLYTIINTIANIKLTEINKEKKKINSEVINISIKLLNVFIWIVGILVVLHLTGVELTAVISGLGIGALAVALAAKDSLANFFGTLSILFSDVFSQGDWIEVDGNQGTVVEIGLRVTKLRTFDNALVAIPNAVLANKNVINWNKRSLGRRIKMHIGVKYDSKRENIQKAISEIYNMLDKHSGIATQNTKYAYSKIRNKRIIVSKDDEEGIKKTLLVYLDEFGPSSVNILIYCFSKSVVWSEWLEVKQDVMLNIMEILEKNSLEFAFPSLSVYHENELDLDSSK